MMAKATMATAKAPAAILSPNMARESIAPNTIAERRPPRRQSHGSQARCHDGARMSHHGDQLSRQAKVPPADHSGRRRPAGTGVRATLPRATTASTPALSKPDESE